MSVYNINGEIIDSGGGLSEDAKSSLLTCFNHLALWDNPNGTTYINLLDEALHPNNYPKITAVLDSSYTPVMTDNVNTLKPHMTVRYFENESSTGQIISAENYTLTGDLNNLNNDVIVTYNTYTTKITVSVLDIYSIYRWEFPLNSLIHSTLGTYGDPNKVNSANNRRSLYLDHGKAIHRVAYSTGTSINNGNAFYIPVPKDATRVTVTINPSSWSVAFSVLRIIEGSPIGWIAGADGWSVGTKTATFKAADGLVIGVSYQNGNNSLVSSDASSIVIEFS